MQFVTDLQHLCTPHSDGPPGREHYTAVLNALRCGIPASDVLQLAPGMFATDLLAAYVDLERRRMQAWQAWQEITEDPSRTTITAAGPEAALLLPVPVERLYTSMRIVRSDRGLRTAVRTIVSEIRLRSATAAAIEAILADRVAPDPAAVKLGAQLHNPAIPALWGDALYLPDRVTALSPLRVAALLGELRR